MFVTKFVESVGCSTLYQLTRNSGVLVLLQTIGKKKVLEVEKRGTRTHSLENSLWKGLCACRKRDYKMLMAIITGMERTGPLRYLFVQWHCLDVINP